MSNLSEDSFKEKLSAAKSEMERRMMAVEERKKSVKKEYQQLVTIRKCEADIAMVKTAQALREVVDKNEYNSILSILDKAVLPSGFAFGVSPCDMKGHGDYSKLFVQTPDGKQSESVFEFFRFENSPMGAWQAFLLHQMWHYLPLWWHANYDARHYHYSQEDAHVFDSPLPDLLKREIIPPDFSRFDLSPEVYHEGGNYYISSCFWTDFGGLIREYAKLSFKEGKLEDFFVFDEQTLVEYDCGISF